MEIVLGFEQYRSNEMGIICGSKYRFTDESTKNYDSFLPVNFDFIGILPIHFYSIVFFSDHTVLVDKGAVTRNFCFTFHVFFFSNEISPCAHASFLL